MLHQFRSGTPAAGDGTPRSASPMVATPLKVDGLSFEASILQSVEIDLGDF